MSHDEAPPDPLCAEHPVPWLLWRQNLQPYFRSMTADKAAALNSALRSENFGEICEALAKWLPDEEIPLRAASLLGLWVDSGVIVDVAQSRTAAVLSSFFPGRITLRATDLLPAAA